MPREKNDISLNPEGTWHSMCKTEVYILTTIVIRKTQSLTIQMRTEVNVYKSPVFMLWDEQYTYEIGNNALITKE